MYTYNNKMVTANPLAGKTCDCLEANAHNGPNMGNTFGGCDKLNFSPPSKFNCSKEAVKGNDSSRVSYVAAYVDTIYDSTEVVGTQIADLTKVSSTNSKYSVVYRNINGCPSALPEINDQASFHVETSYAVVKTAAPARELSHTDFVVNNVVPVSDSVVMTGERSFNVPLSAYDPKIFRSRYTTSEMGSKDAVIIASKGVAVTYMLEYVLCGYVSTDKGTYSFEMTLTDITPKTTMNVTSFYLPEISIPETANGETTFLKVNFEFDAGLISPILTMCPDGTVSFCDTILISPKAIVETIVNKKVMLAVEASGK